MGEMNSNATTARLEEYHQLREELLYSLRDRVWGVATFAILSGAIFAFAARVTDDLVEFLFLALFPMYYF